MDTVNVKINGRDYTVSKNATVLEACREASINIPTLCFMKDINAIGACRLCLVEIKGARSFAAACVQPVSDGMEIMTNTPAIQKARKLNLELMLSDHDMSCLSCDKSGKCELQKYCKEYGVTDVNHFAGVKNEFEVEESTRISFAITTSVFFAAAVPPYVSTIRAWALSAPTIAASTRTSDALLKRRWANRHVSAAVSVSLPVLPAP